MNDSESKILTHISLDDHLKRVRERKIELGLVDSEESTESMRNRGHNRTESKRNLLKSIAERAIGAGLKPIKAYLGE